jgi:hypothetical protein
MEKALEQRKTISDEDHAKIKALVAIVKPLRSVLHKTPDDHGMTGWKDLYIPSDDDTPLEAWYIPARGAESNSWSFSTTPFRCAGPASPAILASRGAISTPSRSTSSFNTSI